MSSNIASVVREFPGVLAWDGKDVRVESESRLRSGEVDRLVRLAVFGDDPEQRTAARFAVRRAAAALGIHPASIHDYYLARGKGACPGATTPAINVRGLAYHTARAVYRAALEHRVGALVFEIARSEIGYTDQRPAEYAAVVLGAAIREGWRGPVFIQGDHFQVNAKKYAAGPEAELLAIRELMTEAVAAGFYNIDIDASTLVTLEPKTIREQQAANAKVSAELTAHARSLEPEGVTISIGGEIGEVGKKNSTVEELEAYIDLYNEALGERRAGPGLSKISIQTGTSHGGVVLPDGTLAQVAIDFDCLESLGRVARQKYGLGGAVQHGASTLPAECFDRFSRADAVEVHLATNFQNLLYDSPEFPDALRQEIYDWLKRNAADEKKPKDTDEQFFYKSRKKALGPFKRRIWDLPPAAIEGLGRRLEENFSMLFEKLGVAGTRDEVGRRTRIVETGPHMAAVLKAQDDTSLDD